MQQQVTLSISSSNKKRIAAIAELVANKAVIDGEAIYNAIEDAGNAVVEGYDLESWYDNCGEECYAGNLDKLEEEDAHELCMQVKEQVFERIKAKAQQLKTRA